MTENIKSARNSIGRESLGFGAAELASMGISLGVVAVFDNLIPKDITHAITKTVAKVCVEPFLDPIETVVGKVCKLEECQADKSKPREERAENIARWLVIGGTAWGVSLSSKFLIRRFLNEKLELPPEHREKCPADASIFKKAAYLLPLVGSSKEEKMICLMDEGVHYGSLIVLNNQGAKFTDDHIRTTKSMLQKCGFSEKSAQEMSTWIWVWEAPNIAGMAAGMAAVVGKHAYGWPHGHTNQSFTDLVSGRAHSLVAEHSKG